MRFSLRLRHSYIDMHYVAVDIWPEYLSVCIGPWDLKQLPKQCDLRYPWCYLTLPLGAGRCGIVLRHLGVLEAGGQWKCQHSTSFSQLNRDCYSVFCGASFQHFHSWQTTLYSSDTLSCLTFINMVLLLTIFSMVRSERNSDIFTTGRKIEAKSQCRKCLWQISGSLIPQTPSQPKSNQNINSLVLQLYPLQGRQ